jgi:ATP-dependent Lhr-like helicase
MPHDPTDKRQQLLGSKSERKFGRKNFTELFAVFSSPQTYTVQTGSGQQ